MIDIVEELLKVAGAGDVPPKGHPILAKRAADEICRLRAALAEIAKGEGRFSTDHLTHASNTIEDMKQLALSALSLHNGGKAQP